MNGDLSCNLEVANEVIEKDLEVIIKDTNEVIKKEEKDLEVIIKDTNEVIKKESDEIAEQFKRDANEAIEQIKRDANEAVRQIMKEANKSVRQIIREVEGEVEEERETKSVVQEEGIRRCTKCFIIKDLKEFMKGNKEFKRCDRCRQIRRKWERTKLNDAKLLSQPKI